MKLSLLGLQYNSLIHNTGFNSFTVNLVHEQSLTADAAMGAMPQLPEWSANKAIDGVTAQNYDANSCAITNWESFHNTSIWWKVWLKRPFNIAYLEIYFRSDSM